MENRAPTSRPKALPPTEEDAGSVLKLGEMQNSETLTVSEAAVVVNAVSAKRKDRKGFGNNEILQRTLEYFDAFARYKNMEAVEAVERLLSAHPELAKFERAQLGSLCCTDADEAKTLIPSLADKISDEDLQDLLNELAKLLK